MSRFIVNSITGWPISEASGNYASGHEPATSYSVLDTLYNYREVARFYAGQGFKGEWNKRQAEACAARLNGDQA